MTYNPKDRFFLKAKKENFLARSIYKLEEIDKKVGLFRTRDKVLDLGASPGSWTQYASKIVGDSGLVVAIDLQAISAKGKNIHVIEIDLRDLKLEDEFSKLGIHQFDSVISDMAPKTTGIKSVDQARSAELCDLALATADRWLKPKGHFVVKFFHSDGFQKLHSEMKKKFARVEVVKPESTRRESKEIFLVGVGKK